MTETPLSHTRNAETPLLIQREAYVVSSGVPLYLKCIGNGRPMLVLHGGPGSTHDYLVKPLLPLALSRELIFLDQRGCGKSGAPVDDRGYTMAAMVDDIEQVRRALGVQRIDIFGHSFGGILAQAYALAHPTALDSLLLAGTASSAADLDRDLQRVKQSAAPEVLRQIEAIEASGIYGSDGAQLEAYRRLCDTALSPFMYTGRPPAWDVPAPPYGWRAMRRLWGDQSDFRCTGDAQGFDFLPELHRLRMPALVIYGSHDIVSEASVVATHKALPGSQLLRLENAGHEMYVDQPAAFISAVQAFLEQHGSAKNTR